jgi:two-component system, sensor histidine kinase
LVKNLTQLHGGEIAVSSPGVNLGSTFTLYLKLVDQPSIESTLSLHSDSKHESIKILVIDDNVDAARTLAELLEISGNEVRTSNTGKDGLATAIEFLPKVVFLDIGLPDSSGYEIAKQIRLVKQISKSYLIALTGYGTEADQKLAMDSGFDLHITKPLDFEKIAALNLGL